MGAAPAAAARPRRPRGRVRTARAARPALTRTAALVRTPQEQERVRWEAQSKFAQEEAQRKAQLAQYEDELARK
jgi:hypothetical protein